MQNQERKWFFCKCCGFKLALTDKKAVGGAYIKCKKCGNEIEIFHQDEVVELSKIKFLKSSKVLEKKWFYCPCCSYNIMKTDERAVGGVYIKCKKCGNEAEVVHQKEIIVHGKFEERARARA